MHILVFDSETTGLSKSKFINPSNLHLWPHVVQFSYIIFDTTSNSVIKVRDFIIKIPDTVVITEENSNIHGITNDIAAAKGVNIQGVLEEFFEDFDFVDNVVGHNVAFDLNMVKVEVNRLLLESDQAEKLQGFLRSLDSSRKIYCTMQDSIDLCNIEAKDKFGKTYIKFPKLIELYQKLFNVTPKNLHNSLNDVIVCLRCFIKMKYDTDVVEHSEQVKQMIKDYL
jgi:DNA polymerase III epsilon subunit-like protein